MIWRKKPRSKPQQKEWLQEQARVEVQAAGARYSPGGEDDLIACQGLRIYDQMLCDSQVRACFNLKRLGALSANWTLIPADQDSHAPSITDFIQWNLQTLEGGVFGLLWRAMDALAKGFSVLEKLYEIAPAGKWQGLYRLRAFKSKDPALFAFDLDPFRNVRALLLHAPDGEELRLNREKFVLYVYQPRYELPFGQPDLRAAYPHWQSKQRVLRDWSIFLSKHASPTLVGIYKRGATRAMQQDLLDALDRVQQETAIVMPEEVEVKPLEFNQSGGSSYYEAITYHNAEIAKSLLGQTLSTDEGQRVGSLALGKIHFEVLKLQLRALRAELAERVMNDQIIKPLVQLNFGDTPAPRFEWIESHTEES